LTNGEFRHHGCGQDRRLRRGRARRFLSAARATPQLVHERHFARSITGGLHLRVAWGVQVLAVAGPLLVLGWRWWLDALGAQARPLFGRQLLRPAASEAAATWRKTHVFIHFTGEIRESQKLVIDLVNFQQKRLEKNIHF